MNKQHIYDRVIITVGEDTLQLHDKTMQAALEQADYLGLKQRKWYEFWKPKRTILAWNNYSWDTFNE